jgi:glycosyltransferase involved in cell wall biosynthesis
MSLLSVIVPVGERWDPIRDLHAAYTKALEGLVGQYEFIYVLDGPQPQVESELRQLVDAGHALKIIKLARRFGESTALCVGFDNSRGELLLTLPAYLQIDPQKIPELFERLGNADMCVARRWPRWDGWLKRSQSYLFHLPLRWLAKADFRDLGCGVRLLRRRVIEEVRIYGDQHRFIPVLATRHGFKVEEVSVSQATPDARQKLHGPPAYVSRLLDIFSVFFLVKFTKRPLRFFGGIGSALFVMGLLVLLVLTGEKLFLGETLGDRPLLLLGSLLTVLGIQVVAIGLIGEIIIFTHARDVKDYVIEEIVG